MKESDEIITAKVKPKRPGAISERTPMPEQNPVLRRGNFREVALGYSDDLAVKEAERCLECREPRCIGGCPVGVPIPQFIKAIKERDFRRAIDTIKSVNMLPAVCGRVCPQETQCEKVCIMGKRHQPVAIGRLERFAADLESALGGTSLPGILRPTGRSVAVVGSGPAGLACAYDLVRLGHMVTLYEALHEPGGVLIYGIPEFRLPKAIVSREIKLLRDMGVEIITNAVVGKLITIDEIMQRYDACFIGTGAGLPRFLGMEGEDLNGVYSANEFLTRTNLMRAYQFPQYDTPVRVGERVCVVGGGNVAIDSARTAIRLGAKEVYIIYRRSMNELPARAEEVHHAKEEGVVFELCTNPVRVIGEGGCVKAIECVRMNLCELDDSGRRMPKGVKGSEFQIPVDTVIIAIGTGANPIVSRNCADIRLTRHGYIVVDEETGQTSREGVFAGGDIVTGSATVILAMGAGRKAARGVHEYLMRVRG